MYTNEYQAALLRLLDDSPIKSSEIIEDVRTSIRAGEIVLAFETLCEWIYEDSLPISRPYYERIVALAADMQSEELVERLGELVEAVN
jgi:hypothetical protein